MQELATASSNRSRRDGGSPRSFSAVASCDGRFGGAWHAVRSGQPAGSGRLAGVVIGMHLYAVIGVGLGALIRHQVAPSRSHRAGCSSLRPYFRARADSHLDLAPWRGDRRPRSGRHARDCSRYGAEPSFPLFIPLSRWVSAARSSLVGTYLSSCRMLVGALVLSACSTAVGTDVPTELSATAEAWRERTPAPGVVMAVAGPVVGKHLIASGTLHREGDGADGDLHPISCGVPHQNVGGECRPAACRGGPSVSR